MEAQPFTVDIPQATLDDLQERLARTRWPHDIAGAEWAYGPNLDYVKELACYWQSSFHWRVQERVINTFAYFRANLDGIGIYFIHERGKGPDPMPLIITHGWPSSFLEMLIIIPLLTDPASHRGDLADAFHVVVPRGGHFAANEKPELLAEDIRAFFRPLQ